MIAKYIQALKEYVLSHEPNVGDGESILTLESELDRSCFDIPPACRKVRKCRNPNTCETIMNMTVSY